MSVIMTTENAGPITDQTLTALGRLEADYPDEGRAIKDHLKRQESLLQGRSQGAASAASTGTKALERKVEALQRKVEKVEPQVDRLRIERARSAPVEVRSEPDVYRADGPHNFLRDVLTASGPEGSEAVERLAAHRRQVHARDVTTASWDDSATPLPKYLAERREQLQRQERGMTGVVTILDMPPEGAAGNPLMSSGQSGAATMTFNTPQLTTATSVAWTAENEDSSETDPAWTDAVVTAHTVRGAADIAMEAVHRGVNVQDSVIDDLSELIDITINKALLSGTGTGQPKGILAADVIGSALTKTDADNAAPTPLLAFGHLVDLLTLMATTGTTMPTHLVLHPRRFGYLASATSAQGPLFESLQTATPTIAGVPVVVDIDVPTNLGTGTNQDVAIGLNQPSVILYRSPLMVRTGTPQLHAFTHTLVVGRLVAVRVKRPTSLGIVRGTVFAAT